MTTATMERAAVQSSPEPAAGAVTARHIQRFDRSTRALHVVIMVTFLLLAATDMPILFSDAAWGRALALLFGGFTGAGLVHRAAGAVLLAAVVWHVTNVGWRAFVRPLGAGGDLQGRSQRPDRHGASAPGSAGSGRRRACPP